MKRNRTLVLGVDGGQTSTGCVVLSSTGKVLGSGTAGCVVDLMHPARAQERMDSALGDAIATALKGAGASLQDIASAYLSLTGGLGHAQQTMSGLLLGAQIKIDADTVSSLYCGRLGQPGIGLICGTGANALLIDARGQQRNCGGWGYLFGDAGSGQWIALEVMRQCARMSDQAMTRTGLLGEVLQHFQAAHMRDVVGGFYAGTLPREALSPLTPLALRAAESGDPIAQDIIQRAAQALTELVVTVARSELLSPGDRVVVGSGGPLSPDSPLWQSLRAELHRTLPDYQLIPPVLPPVLCTGLQALELLGPISDSIVELLQQQSAAFQSKFLHHMEVVNVH